MNIIWAYKICKGKNFKYLDDVSDGRMERELDRLIGGLILTNEVAALVSPGEERALTSGHEA